MKLTFMLALSICLSLVAVPSLAQPEWKITVTNLTKGQTFTPIMAASHDGGIKLFKLGKPASPELVSLAEEGNTVPLMDLFSATDGVLAVGSSGALLFPGESLTFNIARDDEADHLSLAAMLIPTNDSFVALNNLSLRPRGRTTAVVRAYDAGSEMNDELCASIPGPALPFPGPECGAGGAPGGGEGYVYIHPGIHGIGDLAAYERDWRNPVARVVVHPVE